MPRVRHGRTLGRGSTELAEVQCRCRLVSERRHWRARAPASGTEYHPFAIVGLLGDARQRVVLFVSFGEPILVDRHDFAVIEADQVVVDSQRFLGSVDLRDGTAAAMGEWNAETRDDCAPLARELARVNADTISGLIFISHVCSLAN